MDLVLAIGVSLLAGLLCAAIKLLHGFRFVIELSAYDVCPFGYGVAWSQYYNDRMTVMPIPFNILAGSVRSVYFRCFRGFYFQRLTDRTEYLERRIQQQELQIQRDRDYFSGSTERI